MCCIRQLGVPAACLSGNVELVLVPCADVAALFAELLCRLYLLTWHMGEWRACVAKRSSAALAATGFTKAAAGLLSSHIQCSCILAVQSHMAGSPCFTTCNVLAHGLLSRLSKQVVGI
jgi:hypothetical protein